MYGIYANIGGILMVNVTIYSIHGSYGLLCDLSVIFGSTNSQKKIRRFLSMSMFFSPRGSSQHGEMIFVDQDMARKRWKSHCSETEPWSPWHVMNRCYQIAIEFIVDIGCWMMLGLPCSKMAAYRQSNMVCWKIHHWARSFWTCPDFLV